ncbi:hypothetical protein Goshw_014297 [Gossypium schwendimanii]|uniref:Non-specific lipid-transfer protein n=1 Tax=Gossypium schwendimanii TaxID=34291 RepID=A0A7J9LVS3_GOSSC|nr:hypothetical protein [Gossypium schwendimanii]
MMGSRIKISALGVTMLLLLIAPASNAAISCSVVIKDLRPCVNYLTKGSGKPPPACCAGVSALASATSSSADKKAACACIKSASKNIKPNNQLAQALPSNCGISLSITISPNVDWLVESLEAETGSAWMGMNGAAIGVVMRNDRAELIAGLAKKIDVDSAEEANCSYGPGGRVKWAVK